MTPSRCIPGATVFFALVLTAAVPAAAASNIDPTNVGRKFGWTENGGWMNLQGDVAHGVHVSPKYLQGFAWHENFGWINFGDGSPAGEQYSNTSATDFGVNVDESGNLSGYAWGENIGWISFDTVALGGAQVSVELPTGRFTGHAWGENIGWISFETVDAAHVAHTSGFTRASDWTYY